MMIKWRRDINAYLNNGGGNQDINAPGKLFNNFLFLRQDGHEETSFNEEKLLQFSYSAVAALIFLKVLFRLLYKGRKTC